MRRERTRSSLLLRLGDARDDEAWRSFDETYRELIERYCRSRGLRAADADDVRQVVLMSLARAFKGFRYQPGRGRFHSYLGRVVDNAIRRMRVADRRAPELLDDALLARLARAEDADVDEAWECEWVGHHLRLAMRTVRASFEPRSMAMFDRILAGSGTEAVAEEFGVSPQAVHKVKQRIRRRLADQVALQIREEGHG